MGTVPKVTFSILSIACPYSLHCLSLKGWCSGKSLYMALQPSSGPLPVVAMEMDKVLGKRALWGKEEDSGQTGLGWWWEWGESIMCKDEDV